MKGGGGGGGGVCVRDVCVLEVCEVCVHVHVCERVCVRCV